MNNELIRPVALPEQRLYPPEEIEDLVNQVISMDRLNHPQRFKSAVVTPFKLLYDGPQSDCGHSAD